MPLVGMWGGHLGPLDILGVQTLHVHVIDLHALQFSEVTACKPEGLLRENEVSLRLAKLVLSYELIGGLVVGHKVAVGVSVGYLTLQGCQESKLGEHKIL